VGGEDASADRRTGEREMSRKNMWMMLGLGVMLAVSGVARGAAAAPQASAEPYTGQVQSIKIDHCDQQPGTCAGSLVLAQPGDREVTLAIPAGTTIQRGNERVHLEDLGVGNYVMVQAAPAPSETGNPLGFGFEPQEPRDGGDEVGTNMGERPPTFEETNEP
jgi:hypothetical protein